MILAWATTPPCMHITVKYMQPKTVRSKADKKSENVSRIINIKHYMHVANSFHATWGEQCFGPEQKREACATCLWHERQPSHIS